ncbi:hypothetical protein MXL82_03090 [Staphylococcus gallinarum]|uniref:hypothetical protein n=1 Tax=Staphylococcus gallinarum TaxID=1293 RepID=UPI002DBB8749|nr:hypothetical protein [Staphylococcus gallinarum]MEB6242031.1 hypothetical protein [Staphylococcus gallinarum]MEB6295208.1 hypothetical protein [Staphylococcus gallinarum]
MSRYLNEINEFWQQYLEQYDAVYDDHTLNQIIENNDRTAFIHPQDLLYLKQHFGEDFAEIPRFKKMIDFANGIISINKDRRKVISNENLINPAMARPFFGNPEKADIVILKKHPEKDFNSYNINLSDDTAIEYRKRIVLDIQGKLTFNNEKLFLPYIDKHRWFVKFLYSNSSMLKQFNIDPNRVMVLNFFPYQAGHSAGIPRDFLTLNHILPSQRENFNLLLKMIEDSKERIYICSEEELFISIFKNFTDEKLCTYIKENLFVLASKQNRRITTGNLLSYKEHKLRLRKKEELTKPEYYRWNRQQKEAREGGASDFNKRIRNLQRTLQQQ